MKRFAVLFLVLAFALPLFAAGGASQQQSAAGSGERVITHVTPRPLTVSPQGSGDPIYHPQPATYYVSNPRWPNQPPVSNRGGFPIVQQPLTVRLAHPYYSYVTDYYDNDQVRYLEALTNVRIEWDLLPEVNTMDRVNLMFASGERLPDAFHAVSFPTAMLITLGEAGLIMPLQDIIADNAHVFRMMVEQNPGVTALTTMSDGNTYTMGTVGLAVHPNYYAMRFWINERFMNTLGISLPRTTEEYYQYLIAVRDRDPNGNGLRDEIPFISAIDGWHAHYDGFLMNSFIINSTSADSNPINRRRMFRTETGQIDVSYNKPEFRQGLEYLHRLYAENLMAPETFTLNRAGMIALIENPGVPIVGSLPSGGPHEFANTDGERRTHYTHLPPLRGPNGVQLSWYDGEFAGLGLGTFVLTKDTQVPEVLVKWNDYWYTEDMYTRNRYGIEGRDWYQPDPSEIGFTGEQVMYAEILRWGTPQNAYIGRSAGSWLRHPTFNRVTDDYYQLENRLWRATMDYMPYRFERNVPGSLPFTVEEARDYTMLNAAIIEYVEQTMAQFVTGRLALNDANWNNYVQTIDRLGLSQLLRVTQSAFDRTWGEILGYR